MLENVGDYGGPLGEISKYLEYLYLTCLARQALKQNYKETSLFTDVVFVIKIWNLLNLFFL